MIVITSQRICGACFYIKLLFTSLLRSEFHFSVVHLASAPQTHENKCTEYSTKNIYLSFLVLRTSYYYVGTKKNDITKSDINYQLKKNEKKKIKIINCTTPMIKMQFCCFFINFGWKISCWINHLWWDCDKNPIYKWNQVGIVRKRKINQGNELKTQNEHLFDWLSSRFIIISSL